MADKRRKKKMVDKNGEKLAKFILEEVCGDRFKDLKHEDKPDLQNKDLGVGVEVVRGITEKEAEQIAITGYLMSGNARDAEKSIEKLSLSGVDVEQYVGGRRVTVCPKPSVVFCKIPSIVKNFESSICYIKQCLDRGQNSSLVSTLKNFYEPFGNMLERIESIKPKMKGKPCLLNKDIDEIIEKLGWNEKFDKTIDKIISKIEDILKDETILKINEMIRRSLSNCVYYIRELKDEIDAVKQGKYNKDEVCWPAGSFKNIYYQEICSALEKKLEKLNKNQYGEFKNQYLFIHHDIPAPIGREEANDIGTKLKEKQSNFEKKFSSIFVYSASQQKETLFEFGESEWLSYHVPKDKIMTQQRKLLQGQKKN